MKQLEKIDQAKVAVHKWVVPIINASFYTTLLVEEYNSHLIGNVEQLH